jgi:hypothetical protein
VRRKAVRSIKYEELVKKRLIFLLEKSNYSIAEIIYELLRKEASCKSVNIHFILDISDKELYSNTDRLEKEMQGDIG